MDICFRKTNSRTPCLLRVIAIVFAAASCLANTTKAEEQATSKGNEMATLTEWGNDFSYRQDFCSRYQELTKEGGNFSMKDALSGSELRVHFFDRDYFFRYSESTGIDPDYPGFNAVILDRMAEKGNFTWRNSFAVTKYDPDKFRNVTLQEGLEWGVDKYDLLVGDYAPSTKRMSSGIGFLEGIYDGSYMMTRIKKIEEPPIDWFAYLRPFEPSVWYTILAVIVFSSVCHRLIDVLGGKYETGVSVRGWTVESLYLSILNTTGNYSYEPKSLGGRVFGVVFACWALLLTAAYTANLASFYVLKGVSTPPVLDMQDAIDKGLPICIQPGGFGKEFIQTYFPDASPNLVIEMSHIESLYSGDCELSIVDKHIFDTIKFNAEANPSCLLELQGQKIHQQSLGFATKLDAKSKCPDIVNWVLSYYIMEIKEEGFLAEKWKEHLEFYRTKGHCEEETEGNHRRLEMLERKPSRRNRRLGAGGGAVAEAVIGAGENGAEDGERAMTLKEMAGTMVWQVVGSLFAILLALIGKYEGNISGRKSPKRGQTMATAPLSTEMQLTEITRTMRSMQESICELKRDFENINTSLTGSLLNMNTHAVPTGQSVPSSNTERMKSDTVDEVRLCASSAVDSSTSIVFDLEDTDNCINTSTKFGTFDSHLVSRRERSLNTENGDNQEHGRQQKAGSDISVEN